MLLHPGELSAFHLAPHIWSRLSRYPIPRLIRMRRTHIRYGHQFSITYMSTAEIARTASEAGLSPLVTRIAVVVAEIDGQERALEFITSCRQEDETRARHAARVVEAPPRTRPDTQLT